MGHSGGAAKMCPRCSLDSVLASWSRFSYLRGLRNGLSFEAGAPHREEGFSRGLLPFPPSPGEAAQGGDVSSSPPLPAGCGCVPGAGLGTTTSSQRSWNFLEKVTHLSRVAYKTKTLPSQTTKINKYYPCKQPNNTQRHTSSRSLIFCSVLIN